MCLMVVKKLLMNTYKKKRVYKNRDESDGNEMFKSQPKNTLVLFPTKSHYNNNNCNLTSNRYPIYLVTDNFSTNYNK